MLTGWLILGEKGAYVLHIRASRKGFFEPLRAIQHSDPVSFACFYFALLGIAVPLGIEVFRWLFGESHPDKGQLDSSLQKTGPYPWGAWWAVGLFQSIMVLSHMWAIHLVAAAYMITVKRTSLIFSVIYGKLIFKEREIGQRLAGAILVVLGVGLILIAD